MEGGFLNSGTVFKYDLLIDSLTEIHKFGKINDALNPIAIYKTSNGKIYGFSYYSSIQGNPPVIFEIVTTTDSVVLLSPLSNSLGYPIQFAESPSGNLLLPMKNGGILYNGSIIEINTSTFNISTVYDFANETIHHPMSSLTKFISPNGIENIPINAIMSIYPNPASDILNIEFQDNHNMHIIEIYDVQGRLMQKKSFVLPIVSVDIQHLKSGLYIIKAGNENFTSSIKFIKY